MFSTYFIFRQLENLVDNQKCQAGFRPLCNKILFSPNKKESTTFTFFKKNPTKTGLHLYSGIKSISRFCNRKYKRCRR